MKLSEREIRYRIQCARAYPTEGQIRTVCSDFELWSDLRAAGVPAYDADPDEPPADYRTETEKLRDRNRTRGERLFRCDRRGS